MTEEQTYTNWCEADDYSTLETLLSCLIEIQKEQQSYNYDIDSVYMLVQEGLDAFHEYAFIDHHFNEKKICDTPRGTLCLRRAATLMWETPNLLKIRLPWSLRSRLRLAAGLTVFTAITTYIRSSWETPQHPLTRCCCIQDEHFWIPILPLYQVDCCLELELEGYGPGFSIDPDVASYVQEKPGIPHLLIDWALWLNEQENPRLGFVMTPDWLVSLPAFGFRLQHPRVEQLVQAWRKRTQAWGCIASQQPLPPWQMLQFPPSDAYGKPSLQELRSILFDKDHALQPRCWLLTYAPQEPAKALRAFLVHLLRQATLWNREPFGDGGALLIPPAPASPTDAIAIARSPQGLLVHGNAI
ncbi:MAG: hypothetical protein N3A02_01255, partial [Rectinema sp.]|nr:hypothetical protein [Rectinema sp.]